MKKFAALLFGLLFCLAALAGCGGNGDKETEKQPPEQSGGPAVTPPEGGEPSEEPEKEAWEEDGVFKILLIGNSFTDDTLQYLWNIADSMGIKAEVGTLVIGGLELDRHYDYLRYSQPAYRYTFTDDGTWDATPGMKPGDAILSNNWDFISIQERPDYAGVPALFGEIGPFCDLINYLTEGEAQIVYLETWAYPNTMPDGTKNPRDSFVKYFHSDQMEMYNAVVSTTKQIVLPLGLPIIPSGTAVQNARSSYLGDTLNRDDVHLTFGLGRYLSSLTAIRKLTGRELPADVYKPSSVTDKERTVAIESAENAFKEPFAITQSQYTE